MERVIVDKGTLLSMISLVDFCYRQGVTAAYDIEDDGLLMEFLEKTSEPGVYGFPNERGQLWTWQEFVLRLMSQARLTSWSGKMHRYFVLMGKYGANYLSVFVPCAMSYIRKGVEDGMKNRTTFDAIKFNGRTRVFVTHKGLIQIKTEQYKSDLQTLCFDLERRDAEYKLNHSVSESRKAGVLKPHHYESFRRSLMLVNTSYG